MKNLTLLVLFALISMHLKSQSYANYSDKLQVDLSFLPNKYMGYKAGNHYFSYQIITDKIQVGKIEAQGIGVAVYNDSLDFVEKFELKGEEKKEKFVDMYKYDDRIYLISYTNNKDDNTFYYSIFDLRGNKVGRKEICVADEDNKFEILYSKDNSKVALVHSNDADYGNDLLMVEAIVFENGVNALWNKKTQLQYTQRRADIVTYLLDNKGSLHLFIYKEKAGNKYRLGEYVCLDNKADTYSEIKAPEFPINISLSEVDGDIFLASMQYFTKDDAYEFPALTKLDRNQAVIEIKSDFIKPELLDEVVEANKYDEKKGWSRFMRPIQTWRTSDGKMMVAFELAYLEKSGQGRISYTSYINKDVFVFSFNTDYQVETVNYYPKNIEFDEDSHEKNMSSLVIGDDLYLFYNDDEKNLKKPKKDKRNTCYDGTAVITKVKKDGSSESYSINLKGKELRCYTETCGRFNNHLYMFVVQTGLIKSKDARVVEVDFANMK